MISGIGHALSSLSFHPSYKQSLNSYSNTATVSSYISPLQPLPIRAEMPSYSHIALAQRIIYPTFMPYSTFGKFPFNTGHFYYRNVYKKSIDAKHQRASKQEMQKVKMN
jgi:hypothetical protein